MRVIAISAKGDEILEFKSLHEAARWAGLESGREIKGLIDSGDEYRGVFFDWADEKMESSSVTENKTPGRTESDGNCEKKEKKPSKWDDPEYVRKWRHEWYLQHKEYMKNYAKQYAEDHKEELDQYRKANAEKIKQKKKEWREKHAEEIRAYNREYFRKRRKAKKAAENEKN